MFGHTTSVLIGILLIFHSVVCLKVGRGIADVTGLAAEGILFGYASPDQDARGLHLRQYSRAFVFQDDNGKKAAFVIVEVTMISQAVHLGVMEELIKLFPDGRYDRNNVMLSPTHSHSAPGGYNTYWLYQAPSGGAVKETYDAVVNGVAKSIRLAEVNLQDARVFVNKGEVENAGINRSPFSYEQNPEEERARYASNVDKEMTLLKVTGTGNADLGALSFFPVHTTSMERNNHLVSSDNKGVASQLMERALNTGRYPQDVEFLAAFAQTNMGDVSPRVRGAFCNETNIECDARYSNCTEDPYDPSLCTGRGPTGDQFDDTFEVGRRQSEEAMKLYNSATEEISGTVDFRFQWVNMSTVVLDSGEELCQPAMGYSFAAGATDGPGIPPFVQGDLDGDPDLDATIDLVLGVPDFLRECHAPKPILLPTGTVQLFWEWQPDIVPIQILRIGELVLIGMPGEVTTMAGRRTSEAVKQMLESNGIPASHPIVISMANSYTSYITTQEEYSVQRYEGASTIFGPNTLNGYIKLLSEMAEAMANGQEVDGGDPPPDLREYPDVGLPPIRWDALPENCRDCSYGDVLEQPDASYIKGEYASATFIAGSPRHNLMADSSFLEIQFNEENVWESVFTDAHWETRFYWDSNCVDLDWDDGYNDCNVTQTSTATIGWAIPNDVTTGQYRIVYNGHARLEDGVVIPVTGTSRTFEVVEGKISDNRHSRPGLPEKCYASETSGAPLFDFLERQWKKAMQQIYPDI